MPRRSHKNKKYSPELKMAVVQAYFAGKGSMEYLAKKYELADESRVRDWIKCYNVSVKKEHVYASRDLT